jgi:N-acetylneuraminic acid mutarotase
MKLALLAAVLTAAALSGEWRIEPPLPTPRTEVAAALTGREILVAGGFAEDGSSSARVDVFDPVARTWRTGPELPEALNHAAAATLRGTAVVLGGYGANGPTRTAVTYAGDAWRSLPKLPVARAAAAAVALHGRVYLVGGVAPGGLARNMLAYDPAMRRWSSLPGPTPRQHLGATAAAGRVYAVAGRSAGYDTNTTLVESWAPGEKRWRREPALPDPRGGTAAATVAGSIVSVGGESPTGTQADVYSLDTRARRWQRLADLPTPRHGLGAVAFGGRVYVIGGGPEPGLTVSGANEALSPG